MRKIQLSVERRSEVGKGPARRLRAAGKIPAIFYGRKTEPIMLAVNRHEFAKVFEREGANAVYELQIPENGSASTRTAILKDRQMDVIEGRLIHLDFLEVFMDEAIDVSVTLDFTGKSAGVERGGILQISARRLRVSCLPDKIPEVIEIDVSHLDIGESVHVADLSLPPDVKALDDDTMTLATVVAPKRVEVEVPEEEEVEEGAEAAAEEGEEAPAAEGEKTESSES